MAMTVEIVSRETIKPASPTSQGHNSINLSVLDQLGPKQYVPIILFYPNTTHKITDELKKSLPETLQLMYPLAGRWLQNDQSSIKCNDQGVEFIETSIKEDMFTLLRHPKIDLLSQLVPCIPMEAKDECRLRPTTKSDASTGLPQQRLFLWSPPSPAMPPPLLSSPRQSTKKKKGMEQPDSHANHEPATNLLIRGAAPCTTVVTPIAHRSISMR
ncbi:hypothetical protein RJ640_016004 [Escallonia rubra]|uniref:Uncharacterized protein n=1 Tax=Escallonia rubra TaxID=112253 RepID=A0AA88S6I4_9ASTE|nr:hypothetical protein RJ640_016004 [Escallonia rubra]